MFAPLPKPRQRMLHSLGKRNLKGGEPMMTALLNTTLGIASMVCRRMVMSVT